jgi:mono/diheme cytochrome c family protein
MENILSSMNGQEIFNASCTSCHGADGKLKLMGAADLSASSMDLAARIEIIKNGKGAMTPFGSMLNDEQIKAVAEYSQSLKK